MAALTAVEASRVFVPAADPLFCSAKKVGQKRRPLRWRSALRADCTRRQALKREASETRCAQTADASLSVSVPGDASPSNGDPLQKPLQRQRQLQLSLRGAVHEARIAKSWAWCRRHLSASAIWSEVLRFGTVRPPMKRREPRLAPVDVVGTEASKKLVGDIGIDKGIDEVLNADFHE